VFDFVKQKPKIVKRISLLIKPSTSNLILFYTKLKTC